MRRWLVAWLAGWLLTPAWGHLMPAQQGTVNFKGDAAFVVVSLPVSALGADDDRDGLLSAAELQRHDAGLRRRVTQGFRLLDGEVAAVPVMMQLLPDVDKPEQAARHLVVMAKFQFAAEPAHPRIDTDVFGRTDEERSLALRARRGMQVEPIVLTPLRPTQRLFQPAWQAAAGYVEHALQRTKLLLVRLVSG